MVLRNSKSIVPVMIALVGCAYTCGFARAGVIAGLPSVFGPATPQGVPTGETVNVNNDNVGLGNLNRISLVGIEIFGLDPIDISVTIANSPGVRGTTEYLIELGKATNRTEAVWNGFVIALGSGIGNDFSRLSELAIPGVNGLDFDTPDRDPVVSSSTFLSIAHDADRIVLSDGIVPIGELASGQNFSIDIPDIINSASQTYEFTIRLQAMPVPAKKGDFDQDGVVDGRDFLIWQRDPIVGALIDWSGGSFVPGDFYPDGIVDGRDFLAWQRDPSLSILADWETNYGTSPTLASTSAAVPEPTSLLLLVMVVMSSLGAGGGRLVN